MKRIICIGNRYLPEDSAGYEVYRCLTDRDLPEDVELVDGGLAGLNLLSLVEGAQAIVFVDAMTGSGSNGRIGLFTQNEIAGLAKKGYSHASGLTYLLQVLPDVCDSELPRITILGIEGLPDGEIVRQAAELALEIVSGYIGIEEYRHG